MFINGIVKNGRYSVKCFSSRAEYIVTRVTNTYSKKTSRSNVDSPFKLPQVVFDQGIKATLNEFMPPMPQSSNFNH